MSLLHWPGVKDKKKKQRNHTTIFLFRFNVQFVPEYIVWFIYIYFHKNHGFADDWTENNVCWFNVYNICLFGKSECDSWKYIISFDRQWHMLWKEHTDWNKNKTTTKSPIFLNKYNLLKKIKYIERLWFGSLKSAREATYFISLSYRVNNKHAQSILP